MTVKSDAPHAIRATRLGTHRFAQRFPRAHRTHFRHIQGLTISSIGIGTYRGRMSPGFDRRARAAIVRAVANGCNLIDTARNYGGGRSEIVVGNAIRALSAAGIAGRSEVIVCSKAGYVDAEGARAHRRAASTVGRNVLDPAFLSREMALSLDHTGLDAIDIYLVHNPELHLPELGVRKFYHTLTRCFETLERHVDDKKIGRYGLACWSAFDRKARTLLDIFKVMHAARLAGGDGTNNFGVIETPLNWLYRDPVSAPARTSLVNVCRESNLMLLGSSPLLGGRLVCLPSELSSSIPGRLSDPQRSIQFARSIPGVSATLVGMNREYHIEENLRLRQIPALRRSLVQRLCFALDSV
jgi:aryl-alcohol dehydrogenase-like predicted oxidoreductase